MIDVAIVTCERLRQLDPDEAMVLPRLEERGITAKPVVWDDATVDWRDFGATVIRCPWDYAPRRREFVDWAHRVPRLHNSAHLVEWNTDKRYLADLAAAGIPVVPTTWMPPDGNVRLPDDGHWVFKPSVGAGSKDAGRYDMGLPNQARQAAEHVVRLQRDGLTVMAQPYITQVDAHGERALVYLDGAYSHTVRKSAMLTGPYRGLDALYQPETITAAEPAPGDRELAERALAAIPADRAPLYARVDIVDSATGPLVLELEVTEPSLFFAWCPPAAGRFADAIAARIPG